MVFLENYYSVLLLAHLFATFVLVGSMTHNLFCVVGYIRGKFDRQKLEWLYVKVALWAYVIVYVIGALIYPAYRIHIRHEYFDPQLPWATGLFEVKEHWGAVGLGLFFVYYFLRRSFRPVEEKEKTVPLRAFVFHIEFYSMVQDCHRLLSDTSERVLIMKKSDITYISSSVFAAMTVFFYCCTMWFGIKLPRYYPLEHTWKWVKEKGVPSQGWYGMQAFAFIAAGIVTLITYSILKYYTSVEAHLKPGLTKKLGIVVTLLIIACMTYMLYHEFDKWGIFKSIGLQ
jgi:hypothetical protein